MHIILLTVFQETVCTGQCRIQWQSYVNPPLQSIHEIPFCSIRHTRGLGEPLVRIVGVPTVTTLVHAGGLFRGPLVGIPTVAAW